MKTLVVDIPASGGGALTILKEYYEIAKKDEKNEYVFLLSDYYLEETNNIKIMVLKKYKKWINRLKFDFFVGKKIVKKTNPDIIFSLQNTIIWRTKVEQILYVHQPLPFQKVKKFSFFKKKERKMAFIQHFIGFLIKKSIKRANSIIVQTKWMKNAIIDECNIDKDKVKIEAPIIHIDDIKCNKKTIKKNKCIFFYPASSVFYKNHDLIYKAVDLLKQKGIENYEILLTIDGTNTKEIKYLGRISRENVINEYYNSVLLFPSYIETFGLPLLEAKECGSKILASDTEFSHEILDSYDKVSFFNPFNEQELADFMEKEISQYK